MQFMRKVARKARLAMRSQRTHFSCGDSIGITYSKKYSLHVNSQTVSFHQGVHQTPHHHELGHVLERISKKYLLKWRLEE